MNYYEARVAEGDEDGTGVWHFTARRDDTVRLVGYCASCPGHPTPEEAAAHYHEYRLDHRLNLDGRDSMTQRKCQVCGGWTQGYALLDAIEMLTLCDEHRTREKVAELTSPAGKIVSSW